MEFLRKNIQNHEKLNNRQN